MSKISRRSFLKLTSRVFAAVGLGAILGPAIAYFYPSELEDMPSDPVSLGPIDDLPLWKSKTVSFGRYPAMVVNTPNGLRAYSAVCTHFACVPYWSEELQQIVCPCHEGYFDPIDGSVISGPPPAPLHALTVEVIDGEIFVRGI